MRDNNIRAISGPGERVDLMYVGTDVKGKVSSYWGAPTASIPSTNIDGTLWSYIDIHARIKDKVEVVGLGADKAAWFNKANEQGTWAGWISLGGAFVSPLTITSASSTRTDVFGTSTGHKIMHKSKADSASAWSNWDTLEGHWHSSVGAVRRSDGYIDLVALNQGLEMCYKLWDNSNSRPWEVLYGRFKSPPVIVASGSGRVDVFGLNFNNRILHKTGIGTGSSAMVWTPAGKEWEDLGGDFDSPPAAISSAPGRIEIFAVKINGSFRTNTSVDGVWIHGKDWFQLGTDATSAPATVSRATGKVDVMCTFAGNKMCLRACSGELWSDWVYTNLEMSAPRMYTGAPPYTD